MSARQSLAEVFGEGGHGDNSQRFADELYAEIRAEVLREAADALDGSETLRDLTDDHMHDVNAAANELRRMAAPGGAQ